MGLHVHGGTLDGGLTPICESCGVSLCWDIEEDQGEREKGFWNHWMCKDCFGGERMSLEKWRAYSLKAKSIFDITHTVYRSHIANLTRIARKAPSFRSVM